MATSLQQSPIIGLLQIIGRVAQRYGAGIGPKFIKPILFQWVVLTVRFLYFMIGMIINVVG
jgi:hypothetical protein